MRLVSCHSFGANDFEVEPRFLKICVPPVLHMKTSLRCSSECATGPCPQPGRSVHKRLVSIRTILPSTPLVFIGGRFPVVFRLKPFMNFTSLSSSLSFSLTYVC